MIIFDLDGTLADCSHRRHFVDPKKNPEVEEVVYYKEGDLHRHYCLKHTGKPFKPDWEAFYKACDKDTPIRPTIEVLEYLGEAAEYGTDTPFVDYSNIQIWSGRSESVRDKTEKWIYKNIKNSYKDHPILKMRPIGDSIPDDILKESWLDETYEDTKWGSKHPIEYVFDDRPKVIRMWRRKGIFVFNCCQHDEEF